MKTENFKGMLNRGKTQRQKKKKRVKNNMKNTKRNVNENRKF